MRQFSSCLIVPTGLFIAFRSFVGANTDVPCEWKSKTGLKFNLKPLTVTSPTAASYYINDGDIPCTPETEPAFSYTWNFCQDVTEVSIPSACSKMNKKGVALQYLEMGEFYDCYVIGRYDPKQDDLSYSLLDINNPVKGIAMKYPGGDKCDFDGSIRSATIDILCENTKTTIVSAQADTHCGYHLVMKSYYGCPTQCPITENGLCNSHGHCHFDPVSKQPYCYCNTGYSGSSCSDVGSSGSSSTYDGYSVQLGLLITLLLIALALLGVVAYLVYRITMMRKERAGDYNSLPAGSEMVETVHF